MKTADECLAKADECDRLGYESRDQSACAEYARLAQEWRRTAVMARSQDAWAADHVAD